MGERPSPQLLSRLSSLCSGGKAESMAMQDGKLTVIPAQDQSESDRSVRALLHTYSEKRPIVLLLDDNYRLFPYDLKSQGIVYAVLGLYFIKHAWGTSCYQESCVRVLKPSYSGAAASWSFYSGWHRRAVQIRIPVVRRPGRAVVASSVPRAWLIST